MNFEKLTIGETSLVEDNIVSFLAGLLLEIKEILYAKISLEMLDFYSKITFLMRKATKFPACGGLPATIVRE